MANTYLNINAAINGGGGSGGGFANPAVENLDMGAFDIISAGGNSVWTADPADGGTGIQAALDAAFAAGGGIVQLKAGDYEISSRVTCDIDMNNVWLRGVGPATRIIHKGAFNGESILFNSREVQSGAALDNVAAGDSLITFTTPADAVNIQAGDFIFISGIATDGAVDLQVGIAAANGNGTTGEVTLESNTIRSATSATGKAYRNGKNNRITDMAFAYETPAPAVDALAIQMRNQFFSLVENIVVENSYESAPAPGGTTALINFNGNGWKNTARDCRIEFAKEIGIRLVGELDSKIENSVIEIGASLGSAAAISINGTYDCLVTNCDILFSDAVGIDASLVGVPTRRARIENCNVRDCATVCIQTLDSIDIQIDGNNCEDSVFGIDAFPGFNIEAINNIVTRCDVAIRFKTVEGGIMSHNRIQNLNTGANALLVDTDSLNISIVGNNLKDVAASGIFILDSMQCTVQGNVIDGVTSGAGIRLHNSADNNLIMGNSSQNSGGVGILLADDCDNNIVVYNNVNGDGITQGAGTGNDFTGNIL